MAWLTNNIITLQTAFIEPFFPDQDLATINMSRQKNKYPGGRIRCYWEPPRDQAEGFVSNNPNAVFKMPNTA